MPMTMCRVLAVVSVLAFTSAACRPTSTVGPAPSSTTAAPSSASAELPPVPSASVTAGASATSAWHDASWSRRRLEWEPASLAVAPPPGARWTLRSAEGGEDLRAVFGTGRSDVWIGGAGGTLLRSGDGGKTFQRTRLEGGESIASIWAASPDVVWVLGEHHVHRIENDDTLATLSARLDNHGEGRVWGTTPADVWIASGTLAHTGDGGASWVPVDLGSAAAATDVWARSPSDVWVTVPFGVRHSTDGGRTWAPTTLLISVEDSFHVRGAGTADVWILGTIEGPAVSSDGGTSWKLQGLGARRPGSVAPVTWADLWPTASTAWAATSAGVWSRSAGGPWQRALGTYDISAIWAREPGDVWAVGRGAIVLRGG